MGEMVLQFVAGTLGRLWPFDWLRRVRDGQAMTQGSIVLVNLFAKHIRQTQAAGHTQYTVTEMLPDLDQLWLTDRQGQRYSSELRIVAYDSMTEDQEPGRIGYVG
jgi:hypothetical protein